MVSCIIPVHNRSELLKRAIQSVVDQRHPGTELIVVDDDSTEDLRQVVRQFETVPDLDVRYFRIPKGGQNTARTHGQARATRSFVQFLDSDDILLPGKWRTQLEHLQSDPGIDVSVSNTLRSGEGGCQPVDPGYPSRRITPKSFLLDRTKFKIAAPLWRRDRLWEIVEWPAEMGVSADWETHLRAILCGLRFEYCPDSGFVIIGAPSGRITQSPVTEKAVDNIWALYYALTGAEGAGARIPVSSRLLMLVLATRRLLVFLRHRNEEPISPVLVAYGHFLRICL